MFPTYHSIRPTLRYICLTATVTCYFMVFQPRNACRFILFVRFADEFAGCTLHTARRDVSHRQRRQVHAAGTPCGGASRERRHGGVGHHDALHALRGRRHGGGARRRRGPCRAGRRRRRLRGRAGRGARGRGWQARAGRPCASRAGTAGGLRAGGGRRQQAAAPQGACRMGARGTGRLHTVRAGSWGERLWPTGARGGPSAGTLLRARALLAR